jgi:hypothetical protein
MNATEAAPKQARKFILPVILVILAVSAIGFLASKAGLDKALVKQQVDGWIAMRSAQASKEGYALKITYQDMRFAGGFSQRYLVLENPEVTIAPFADAEGKVTDHDRGMRIKTEQLLLHPRAVDLSEFRAELPDAIEFYEGGIDDAVIIVSAATPIIIDGEQAVSKKHTDLLLTHTLPKLWHIKLHALSKASDTETPDYIYENYSVSLDNGGQLSYRTRLNETVIGASKLEAKNVTLTSDTDDTKTPLLRFDSIKGEWGSTTPDYFKSILAITNISGAGMELLSPMNVHWNLRYEGSLDAMPEAEDGEMQTASLNVKEFVFEIPDASLRAKAKLHAAAEDILPIGSASIELKNLPHIRKMLADNALIDASDEVLFDKMLTRITGKGINALNDVTIPLSRERGEPFRIGNITLEEAATMVLTHRYVENPSKK